MLSERANNTVSSKSLRKHSIGIASAFVFICLNMGACSAQTAERPWLPFATLQSNGNFIGLVLFMGTYPSHEDCVHGIEDYIAHDSKNWVRDPFGCGYSSNSYWLVRWMHFWYSENHFTCIGRNTEPALAQNRYFAVIGSAREGNDWHCVD